MMHALTHIFSFHPLYKHQSLFELLHIESIDSMFNVDDKQDVPAAVKLLAAIRQVCLDASKER